MGGERSKYIVSICEILKEYMHKNEIKNVSQIKMFFCFFLSGSVWLPCKSPNSVAHTVYKACEKSALQL